MAIRRMEKSVVTVGAKTLAQAAAAMVSSIDQTLSERGARYGTFSGHALISQAIKRAMMDSPNWAGLPDDMKEALEMNAHKTARILNGDPAYADSWHDIGGYTKLVEDRLNGQIR